MLEPRMIVLLMEYGADVTNNSSNDKFYFGLAETVFREWYRNDCRDTEIFWYMFLYIYLLLFFGKTEK